MSRQPAFTRLLTVIVVYELDLNEVQAWAYLRQRLITAVDSAAATTEGSGFLLDHVLIYDNSRKPRAKPLEHISGCSYVHDAGNGGTAAAYECACRIARKAGIDWLLLLDQDTSLPAEFLDAASAALGNSPIRPAALVPWVFHGPNVVSPARVTGVGTIVPLQRKAQSQVHDLTAISSGSLLHVPTLAALMPMPAELWLDYVDHWIFMQLRTSGSLVVAFEVSLQHDLSVCKVESLDLRRLTSILNGEAIFVTMLGSKARIIYPLRLAARIFRYARKRPDLAKHMFAWIAHRIKCHL